MLRLRAALACLLLALPVLGCEELSKFRTHPGEIYTGDIVGSDSAPGRDSFIRQGFASHTKLDLTFDPSLASEEIPQGDGGTAPAPSPGMIDTYLCPGAHPDCDAKDGKSSLFVHAKLERIVNLSHDTLAQYDFPGGGRVRNYMFFARSDTGKNGSRPARIATVFISLMEDDHVEVRMIAPSVLDIDGESVIDPPLFGVFILKKHRT
jgi:hypothetical protein